MSEDPISQPSEHERRVAEEERERMGEPAPDAAAGRPTYEQEVDSEQEGRRAEEPRPEADDEDSPLDAGYQPRTG